MWSNPKSSDARDMHSHTLPLPWIYADADNTLWGTNALFAEAQLQLLRGAESIAGRLAPSASRLEYLRQYDQAIAESHHARLRYPPALLIRALVHGLQGLSPKAAAARVVSAGVLPSEAEAQAVQAFSRNVSSTPVLLPGVPEGLKRARALEVPVYVVTEGPADIARERLQALSIARYTNGVLSATKTRDLYLRLAEKAKPRHPVMIGDQPDRDIRLPHDAGFTTILVKGEFRPAWTSNDDASLADVSVADFESAVLWVIDQFVPR